jgi:hypothetical protein
MKKELELQLVQEFPTFFKEYGGDMRTTCMHWGCSHGDGWYDLLHRLCTKLADMDEGEFVFKQIKEKFGRLTIYSSGGTQEMNRLIDTYEEMSLFVCEVCGSEENLTLKGRPYWIQNLCDKCGKECVPVILGSGK